MGLLALLVLTYRAMRRPSNRGTSDRIGSTFPFLFVCETHFFNRQKGAVDTVNNIDDEKVFKYYDYGSAWAFFMCLQ